MLEDGFSFRMRVHSASLASFVIVSPRFDRFDFSIVQSRDEVGGFVHKSLKS